MTTKNKNLNFSLFFHKNLSLRKLKMDGTKIGIIIYCTVVAILIIICFIYLYKKLKELLKKSKNKKLIKLHRKHLLFQQIIILKFMKDMKKKFVRFIYKLSKK